MGYDRIDSMYDALVSDGAQIGTRQQFKKLMLAPGKEGYRNRLGFYQAMKQDGANIGATYEDFGRALGLHSVKPQHKAKPLAQKPVQPVKKLTMKQRAQKVAAQYQQTKPLAQNKQQPSTDTASGTYYMKNWQLMHMRNDQMNQMQQAQASNMRARMQRAQEQASQQEKRNPIAQSRVDLNPMKEVNRRFRDMAANGAQAYSSRAKKKKMYDIANANSRSLYENSTLSENFNEMMQRLDTPEARRARAKQQREDDARTLAKYEVEGNEFAQNDGKFGTIAPEIDSLIAPSMKEADDLSWSQYQQALKKAGNDAYLRNKAWKDLQDNRIRNRQNVLADTLSSKLQEIYSQKGLQEHIMQSADKLNMGVEEYVDKYVTPHMMQRAQNILGVKNIEEILPQSATEYVVRRLSDSILGTLSSGQDKSREQIAREQEAMAIADGLEEMPTVDGYKANEGYKSGMGARFVSTAANMAMDSPILGMTGSASNLTVDLGKQVLMNGLAKAGLVKAGAKLTAQQLAFKAANMTMAQKIASGLVEGVAKSALNLGGYSSITAALGQASTGDDTSLSALGKAALGGFEHGATTGAMFGVSGAIMAPWVSKFGITGLEKSTGEKWMHGTQKLGATAAGLGVEAGTMMVADNITGDKDISFGTWLEDVVMVGAFKAGEPKNYAHIGNALYNLTHNANPHFVIGKNANGSPIAVDIRLTPDEKNELISSVSGKNLMDAFVDIDAKSKSVRDKKGNLTLDKHIAESLYKDFMADPEVSQSTKEKVNAAIGLFNTTRGKSYRSVNDVKNKQILEYTKNGTLLTRTSYKNADERRAILYKQKLYRDNDDMLSLIGYSKMKDMQLTDEDGNVTSLALGFLRDNGYDTSKDVTDPKNAQLINDLRNPKSALYLDWEKYVDKNGSYGYLKSRTSQVVGGFMDSLKEIFNDNGQMIVDIDKIMQKDPMKRTDQENKIFYGVKRALEDELFPSGIPHEDQSASQGKAAAEDNNLGTEQPNGEVVLDELRNLRNAEQALDAAMDGNDVFKQVFEKLHQQGLTPAQIYDALIQNGLTQEELIPLAQYINANARVQGMQQATADAIEENVKEFTSDWSYHGTLNGQKMDGEQALYVQDSNGRTLLVGSGYVAFYQTTGRAKEGSGDMLVCLDLNTKEMLYVKADEVTLFQNQPIDQFAAEYRQRLQMKNSEPYNQAAQEQAMQDAAENQDQSESGKGNDASETPEIVSEATPVETPTDFSINNGKGRINSYKATPHEKTKSDGTKEITFSSEVTFTKGAPKGRKEGEVRNIGNGGGFIKIDPIDIDYQQYAVSGRLHDDGTAFSKDEATSEDIAEAKEQIDTLLTPQLAEEMGPQYNVKKIIIAPDGRVFAKFIGMDGNIPLKRNPLEKAPQDDTTKSEDNTTKEGNLTKDDTNLTKDDTTNEDLVPQEQPKPSRKFADGSDVPMATDSKGRPTPDYGKMTPEQSAEILTEDFGENAEKVVDGQIQKAEKALKDAEKMKVDYTAEPNDIMEQEALKTKTVEDAKKQLDHAQNIKKAMTAKKVAETVGSTEQTEGAQEASGGNEPAEAGEGRVKSDLDRITETDEEFEVEGKYGTIYKKKYLIDGDKEVMKVDEPNKNGDYTGSYYEYNGKKYGDLRGVFEHLDDKPDTGSEEMPEGPIYDRKKALIDEINESDIKKKDDAFQILYKAEDLLDDYYCIPHDEWRQEPSRSNTITGILSMARNMLDRIENEPVEPASERQLAFLDSLTKDDPTTREQLEGVDLNKRQASWLIGRIKGLDDNLMSLHPDDIAEAEKEIHDGIEYMKKINGETSNEGGLPLLPNEEKPDPKFNPIEAAAAEFKKEHPLTEEEIMKADVDDVVKDMALDYLNGEVTDDLHRAIYESIFVKTRDKVKTSESVPSVEQSVSSGETDSSIVRNENKPQNNEVKGSEKEETNVKNDVKTADDAAVVASNKKVNDLWKELMNAGKDELSASFVGLNSKQLELLPKLVGAMAENAYLRIKRGMHNLEDVVKEMRKEFAPAAKVFKKEDVDAIYEQMMNIRYRDGEQRMSLKEWADYYEKTSPKHQENLVGDSKSAEERKMSENKFMDRVNTRLGFGQKINGIVELRKMAEECGLKDAKDTDLQELAETAIVKRARGIASSESTNDAKKFELIKKLYENQPSLNQRDSERVMKGQFSTPAPYAYLADMYVKGNGKVIESALEPSAGNGMLTIGLPMDKVHVNDIDAQRLANLRRQGFKNVTSQDGTQPFADKDVDVVVTNPPFGSATTKEYDGYKISSLEGQMAINALDSMKDDGRAAIIIGGKTEYAKNGSLNPKDKAFLGYLYSHYNVEDVINVDGSLFAKQGTTIPTRIILINGRRFNENAFPPVKDKARAETVKDYDELYKRIEDDIHQSAERGHGLSGDNRVQRPERRESNKPSVTAHDSAPNKERVRELGQRESLDKPSRNDRPHGAGMASESMVEKGGKANGGADGEIRPGDNGHKPGGMDLDEDKRRSDGGNVGGQRAEGLRGGDGSGNVAPRQRAKRQGLTTEKVQYVSKSRNPFSLHAVMPADQAEAVQKNLDKLGDVDQFLVDELGYNDKDDMYKALSSEQADSVALAINQMKQGNAFIIGDQTGIGKGRQGAALIRYAVKQGSVPVYLTQDAPLLSTVYRDTVDIGSKELRPFVIASDKKQAAITDQDGNLIYDLPSAAEKKRVFDYIKKYGKLPKEYDYVLTTYKQFASGTTDYENGERTSLKLNKGQRLDSPSRLLGQERRDVVEALMGNGYLILDECHNASGDSGIGHYFQHIVGKAKGVTFISATFAKRPDNMPIYAMRTAMSKAGMEASDLIEAIRTGGTTLQEIMSKTLTESGQMIRRERDMTGVSIDYVPMDEAGSVEEQKTKYDSIIDIFNDIIDFQKRFVDSYLDTRNEELADIQSTITNRKGTKALGIKNQPFASKTFNTVRQLLLGIKAPQAVKRAIECLEYQDEQSSEKGIKPIIFLENTMESNYKDDFENDVDMESPDFGTVLKKGLEGVLRYTQTDAKGKESKGSLSLADLGPEAEARYNEIMNHIAEVNSGMFISPIDYIKHELEKKGYRVGELTGREFEFVFNEDGTVRKQTRIKPNKKDVARKFNNGEIDVIIANKTGATGIDLHAGLKFKDQRPRRELILQNQLNIGDEVQAHGRADRTNQKYRGQYEYILSMIPAEQRLFMMLKSKLKSLYANTTSSQKSKFNEMEVADIINKYGDKVVANYLAEHLDIYSKLSDPLNWESTFGDDLSSIDPQKLIETKASGDAGSGASKTLQRMSLLKVSEQEKVIQEIGELYANEIQRLNEMGENDLEITELPLKAKTIRKEVWKQGAEPGGDNAFADNTYIEKVNMAILKKPMKAAEVKASQEGLTGGKTWEEYKTEKKTAVKEYFDQKIADETKKYEERAVKAATKAKEKYIKDAKKGQKDSGMSDEQIEKMAGYQYDNIYKQEKDKLNDVVKNLKAKAEMFDRVLDTFDTNSAFVLPADMNNPNELSGFGNSYGRLIDIKITDNFSPNASSVSFATLDGRRKITFPIAGKVGSGENKVDIIGSIDRMTKQASGMGDSHLRVLNQNFDNWDRLTSNESRKNGYIVTGNLMQALVDSKDQGLGGQLVKYTTDTGEVKTGILMPDRFDPKGLTTDAPINSVTEKFELSSWHGGIDEVTSSDGEVKVKRIDNYRGNYYEIRVPNSKAKGGKYFTDKELLEMVDGHNFETRGNSMLAEFKPEQLKPVLDRLSKMGVKVQEERKTSENISDAPNVTSVVATGTNNRGLEKKPLLDVKPVGLREWMREHPGKYPTSNDLFGQPHVDAQLGKELGRRVLGVTDAGVKMTRIDYEGGYKIQADGYDGDYINQTYYPDGQVMTRANFDIGMSGSQLEKYIKYDKNRIPYSNINDVVTNFMENIGKSSNSDNGTHFREDRGLQYSKTDTKDVKNSRIIPEDVDKNVSSQIEKKFDDEINRLFTHVTPSIRRWANAAIDLYSKDQTLNSWEVDENKNVTLSEGLNTVIDDLTKKINEYETKYGIRKDANIGEIVNSILRKINSEGSGSGRNTSDKGQQEGTGGEAKTLPGGGGERRALDVLNDYKELSIRKAAAERAKAYILARSKSLQETYGLKRDEPVSYETIDRIFNDYNSDPEVKELYDSIVNSLRSLGTEFYVGSIELARTKGYYKHSENFIKLNVDRLSAAGYTKQDLASTLCHEMLHPLASDIIAMYQKGHTDKLSPSQIEAAKDAVDIYNELIKMQKEGKLEDYYGLENPREMITELASPEWRSALRKIPAAKKWYQKLINAICRMIGKDPKYNKLGEMERTLTNLLDNFGKEQFDFASQNENELFKDEYQGYKVTDKDELDRLNKEKTFRMYSGMQEVDGKLYSPMAAIIDGKRTDATEIGAWMGADERPDLVKNGKFQLVKTDKNPRAGEGPVPAAYNPYMHTSTSMMNDQFTGAYARGNIKVVEWEIPESEKTSGYHAEGAKDSVGLVPWHSGSVNSLLPKDRQRQVMLSRWRKAVRVVPDSEVAESIAEQLKGTGLAIPWNVVTPNQVRELAKLGVPITTVESGRQAPETKEKFLKQMVELEQEFPQAKFVNVKMTKDSYKEWGKDGGTKFRTNHGDGNYPASSVESHVDKVAQKTGAKVNIVSSVDEITNKAAKAAIEEGRKITGWYDEKTGEVHLYMPNIHDRYTAEKTIWHEVVGHKGMRELFGEDRFEKFLRDVWYDLDKPENADLKKLVDEERKYNPLNIYDAIEEGIARLAEDGKGEAGFWNGIKNKVSDFLHEIGYRIAPNTKDVKYLLWLSKNLQKNQNDPYWKMRAEAVKYRLDHDRVPAVVAHDGMFYGNDGKVKGMDNLTKAEWNEATDGEIHLRTTPSAGTALDRYHRSLNEHGYMFTESYMDNMLSLKKLMNAIVPDKKIEDIASSENPYMLQNTMQGAMSDAAQMFERNVMKPLDKAMAGVLDAFDGKKDDEKIRNFNLYMITKHGLERNRVFFVRDFLKKIRRDEKKKQDADMLEQSWYNDKEYLDNELRAGNIDLKEYYRQMDENIRNYFDADFEAGEHDYSGIHAIQEVEKSSDPYDDAEAIQSVMDSEAKMEGIRKGAVKDYWDKVKAATQYSINSDYKNGIISSELYGHVSNMFNWYVPLRKYDESTAEDVYGYITEVGDPKSYIGSTIMRARGHKYLSETNVLAQIGAMGNRAIKNGGMNAIRQAFARFARNNSNNNLITETSVWYEKDPMTGIVYERYPDIPEDATADEINQIVSDFNKDMKAKALQNLASKVYRRGSIGYKFQRAENKSQHIVDVKIAGRTHAFIINGNPRAAQALNGLLENSGAKGIMKPLSSISRMMAQLCTSYNPEFVMRNIMRDAEFASSNVTSKEGARYGALWAKYYAQLGLYKGASNISLKDFSGSTGLGLFAKYRNGTLDMSNKVERYFKEFMENGGETGWVQIKNMKDWTKGYKKDVSTERSKLGKGGAALRDFFFGNLENVNEVAENIARFATYCTSRDSNRSIIRSVYDAKEVSTNFNRHGSGDAISSFKNGEMTGGKAAERWVYGFTASYLRHCSMFFNAGIQSTNLLVKNLKNHPVGTSINMLAIPFALGALAALGNNVLIASEDEKDRKGVKDPYGELPDYVRRNNLCIYKGNGEFVTIPLAIELRAFYGLGDLAAGLTFSPNVSGQKNPYFDAIGCMSQLVPVMDYLGNSSAGKEPLNETIKAITPSALSPFVEWEMNTDWKGAPIERRGDWNEDVPAWQRAYNGTPDGYMALNKFVNAQTNEVAKGNEDMLGNSFLDMVTNPSMLNHYIGGLGGGAATFTERAIGVVKHGKDTETKDIPFLRSLLYTPSEQSSLQRTKSKWYNYKDEMEKMIANVDRLKSKNVPIEKRISNYSDYYRFQNSKDAAKVRVIELAEKQMKQWKKLRDKSSDTESINFANQNIDRIMMEAVDDLDKLN